MMQKMEKNISEEDLEQFQKEMFPEQVLDQIKEKKYDEEVESDMEEFLSSKEEMRKTSQNIFSKKK
jgi:hypothetical protein